ncbi:MAG: HAMP domain-containing protein [Candidatus Omnitrophica bacterium]|nr:HAMP domain-containing protein [Candidatus Omnitrophota bacterium]
MEKRLYKRTRYIVKAKFQMKYVGLLLLVALASATISGYTIYYNSWVLLGEKLANVYPQGRLMEIFKSVNIKLAVSMVFVSMICIGIGILASHKIAGPVHRMVMFLDSLTAGDYSKRLFLRKKDELKDLAEAINRLTVELDKKKKA